MLLLFALVLNIVCTAANAFWFQRALRNPTVYPRWYTIMTGIFALYCLMNVIEVLPRL